jgi:hypothetical protein
VAVSFRGERWTVSEGARDEFGLRWIFGTDNTGASPDPDRIHTGKNSGYQAIGLAHVFGAGRIVLLGFDMCNAADGRKHWHGNHPSGLSNGGHNRYDTWRRVMGTLADDLAARGVKVLNASRRTALKCFRRVTLETALDEIRSPERATDPRRLPEAVDRAVR